MRPIAGNHETPISAAFLIPRGRADVIELPANIQIHAEMAGGKTRVTIYVTLETTDHADALIEALKLAVIPILQMVSPPPQEAER